jgi:hypothetical protein
MEGKKERGGRKDRDKESKRKRQKERKNIKGRKDKDNELLLVSIIVINKAVMSGCQLIIIINICLNLVKFENIWFFGIKAQLVL